MTDIDTLTELFTRFPGIGPRQAKRFVLFLLRQDAHYRDRLIHAIEHVAKNVKQCTQCLRYAKLHVKQPLCNICADINRSKNQLMLVEKDNDIDQMEKSGSYQGLYFVLGGTLSLTGKKSYLREKELKKLLLKNTFTEIILALSTTPDGEYTSSYLTDSLKDSATITVLGRGLSTGAELEYADSTTLTQALQNRS